MRHLLITLLIFVLACTGYSQKSFKEGKIIYTITYPDMDLDPQQAAILPKVVTMYVKGDMVRMEMNMGMGMSNVTITNAKEKSVTTLVDAMGQKYAMKITEEEMKKQAGEYPEPKIENTGQTKEIAGYKCEVMRVSYTDEKGKTFETDICISKEFAIPGANWSHPAAREIDGLMLEYEMDMQQLKMKMTLKSIKEEAVADNMFTIPDGYEVKSMEELRNMR